MGKMLPVLLALVVVVLILWGARVIVRHTAKKRPRFVCPICGCDVEKPVFYRGEAVCRFCHDFMLRD